MNSREHSDMPPAQSYPSPNAAQIGQGTMPFYSNRQLTADELLSAELSRETSATNLADGSGNGVAHHGLSSTSGGPDMGRAPSPDQHQHQQQQHLLQFTPGQQVGMDPNHDLSYGDQSARRKRSKISRACDECRRKKVRCDASSESGVDTCSNCRRLGAVCQFSRVPMKRGPSKGYIKELAERLHTLESQMQPPMVASDIPYQPMNEMSPPRGFHDFPSPIDGGNVGRKRTFSVFEGFPSASFTQPAYHPRGSQNAFDTGELHPDPENPAVTNNTAPKPTTPFWSSTDNDHDLAPAAFDDATDGRPSAEEDKTPVMVDEKSLNNYYETIHRYLNILPHLKAVLLENLHQCSREVQEIFLHSLYAVTRAKADRVGTAFEKVPSFDAAQDLLLQHARRSAATARPTAVNIVLLEALLFMILECDVRGPDNVLLKSGQPKYVLLQAATKLGYDVAKNLGQLRCHRSLAGGDIDAHPSLARRCWIALNILARWHALSVADSTVLVGSSEIAGVADEKICSPTFFQLAAYSTFVAEMTTMVTVDHNVCQTNTGLGRVVAANLVASLERLSDIERQHKPDGYSDELQRTLRHVQDQMYWTIRLVITRHVFVYSPFEIIYCAKELVDTLHRASDKGDFNPFDLHSLALALMTLEEASSMPEYTNECHEYIGKIERILIERENAYMEGSEMSGIMATPSWDALYRAVIDWRRGQVEDSSSLHKTSGGASTGAGPDTAPPVLGPNEQRSLQHLADLAVGAEGSVSAAAAAAAAGASSSPPPPPPAVSSTDTTSAHPTTAAAAASGTSAASPNLAPHRQPQERVVIDFTMLTSEGYLNVFAKLLNRRFLSGDT